MGRMNVGPEAWEEGQDEVQKILSRKGYNNYTACSILLSLASRILTDVEVDQAERDEIVGKFLKSMGYAS